MVVEPTGRGKHGLEGQFVGRGCAVASQHVTHVVMRQCRSAAARLSGEGDPELVVEVVEPSAQASRGAVLERAEL